VNIASYFAAYQLLERRVTALEAENRELLNKLLLKAGHTPMFYQPPEQKPVELPPIGPSQKRARLAQVPESSVKSDEEILEAAKRAMVANGGQS
jgi:endonuclease YncB( thermonuclease family)